MDDELLTRDGYTITRWMTYEWGSCVHTMKVDVASVDFRSYHWSDGRHFESGGSVGKIELIDAYHLAFAAPEHHAA